jgi:hypothetical protein
LIYITKVAEKVDDSGKNKEALLKDHGGNMKFLKRTKKKVEEQPDPNFNQLKNETDIRILDSLINDLFDIDDERAEKLEKKSQ